MTNNNTNNTNATTATRKNTYKFGVIINAMGDKINTKGKDIMKQMVAKGDYLLDEAAQFEFDRYLNNGWDPNMSKIRNKMLRESTRVTVLTYKVDAVRNQVLTAVYAGTPVFVYSPFAPTPIFAVSDANDWNVMCNESKDATKQFAAHNSMKEDFEDLRFSTIKTLNTQATWLGFDRLHNYTSQFKTNMEALHEDISAKVHALKELGEWDTEVCTTMLQKEMSSTYMTIESHGVDKGRRVMKSSTKEGLWRTDEVTLNNELQELLSLSYYQSVGIKPLNRISVDEDGQLVYKRGEELTTTPIYFEEEHIDDMCPLEEQAGYNLAQEAIRRIGETNLSNMSYEEAKAVLKKVVNKL